MFLQIFVALCAEYHSLNVGRNGNQNIHPAETFSMFSPFPAFLKPLRSGLEIGKEFLPFWLMNVELDPGGFRQMLKELHLRDSCFFKFLLASACRDPLFQKGFHHG